MEEKILLWVSCLIGLVIFQHVLIFYLIFRVFHYKKEFQNKLTETTKLVETTASDQAVATLKLLQYLENNFETHFNNQKKIQDWTEKNLDVVVANTNKSFSGIEQTQRFLGRMSEALGIVQRSNLQEP
jgi:nitrogenase molybdenum-iron protein alpha/beta subunit